MWSGQPTIQVALPTATCVNIHHFGLLQLVPSNQEPPNPPIAGNHHSLHFPVGRAKSIDQGRAVDTINAAVPSHSNTGTVRSEIVVEDRRKRALARLCEGHHVRYLFLPELENILEAGAFELAGSGSWLRSGRPAKENWFVWAQARKRD